MGMGNAGTSSAGSSFISTLVAKMPYTYKVLQNANERNPKYDLFRDIITRPQDRVRQQSVYQSPEMGGGASGMVIDKRYHEMMYADVDLDKVRRIQEYRKMAAHAEVAECLDEIADEAIVMDKDGEIVKCKFRGDIDKTIRSDLEDEWHSFIQIYDLENRGWELIRRFLTEGEVYFENVISENRPDYGIIGAVGIPTELINPIYDNLYNQVVSGFLLRKPIISPQKNMTNQAQEDLIPLDRNQVTYIHSGMWNEDNSIRLPYIENSRRAYKQLSLVEDSIIIYRLVRAPERLVFKVDVGNMSVPKAEEYVRKLMQQYWSKRNFDTSQGRVTNVYDPQSMLDAYWFTKRGQSEGTDVTQLPGGCLDMNTRIPLLDGRVLTLHELTTEYNNGKQNWVYSCDPQTGHVVPGKVDWAGVTQESAKVMKITFNNGEHVICTLDHKFPTIFRGKLRADELQIGDSIYSTQRRHKKMSSRTSNTYEQVYHHDTKEWEFTHRMVSNFLSNTDYSNIFIFDETEADDFVEFNTVHHLDVNRYNNVPENLVWMDNRDHALLHACLSSADINTRISKGVRAYIESLSPEGRASRADICRKNRLIGNTKYSEMLKDPVYRKQVSANISNSVREALKDPQKRARRSEINKERWENNVEYRDIMISSNYKRWSDPDYKARISETMSLVNSEDALKALIDVINETQIVLQNELVEYLNEHPDNAFTVQFLEDNKHKNGWSGKISLNLMKKFIRSHGYVNYAQFRREFEIFNHTVTNIEYMDEEIQVGTLTIDNKEELHGYHTFLLESEVFTYNSNLGTLDDLMYFVKKLYRSLKVPQQRLDPQDPFQDGESITREELRFARFIIRIQGQIARGLKEAFITHLKLREKKRNDPDSESLWEQYHLREHQIVVEFNQPSSFAVMREQQIFDLKKNNYTGLAASELISDSFCQKYYLGLDEYAMAENREWLRKDASLSWEIQQIVANGPNFREKLQAEAEMGLGDELQGLSGGGGGSALPADSGDQFTPDVPPEFGPGPEVPAGEAPPPTTAASEAPQQ